MNQFDYGGNYWKAQVHLVKLYFRCEWEPSEGGLVEYSKIEDRYNLWREVYFLKNLKGQTEKKFIVQEYRECQKWKTLFPHNDSKKLDNSFYYLIDSYQELLRGKLENILWDENPRAYRKIMGLMNNPDYLPGVKLIDRIPMAVEENRGIFYSRWNIPADDLVTQNETQIIEQTNSTGNKIDGLIVLLKFREAIAVMAKNPPEQFKIMQKQKWAFLSINIQKLWQEIPQHRFFEVFNQIDPYSQMQEELGKLLDEEAKPRFQLQNENEPIIIKPENTAHTPRKTSKKSPLPSKSLCSSIKVETFESLVSPNDKDFVIQAMRDLKITNESGDYILSIRKRGALLGFCHALKEGRIIPKYSDIVILKAFCDQIKTKYSKLNKGSFIYQETKDCATQLINDYRGL